ncbi:steroid 5-alpha-reductase DET2-like [Euphorbia lathyris]|uniref:steroid 5-alpha-reductase DET2-like n=1 Tax=Euphorbia lathyris TaxID=212925 RepID=UPI0033136167
MEAMSKFLFPAPSNWFVSAMSVVSLVSLANAGLSEIRGNSMKYSKFFNETEKKNKKIHKVSGRNGMLIAYTPAFMSAVASFAIFPDEGVRALLVKSALTFHFFKRILEVVFIHKYSGGMEVETAIPISLSYLISAVTMVFAQHLTQGYAGPEIDMSYPGIVVFLIGMSGNLYHHYLLSKLRSDKDKDKEYKVPRGGLFKLVICPHYMFEIIGFWGVSFMSQTLYAFCFTLGTTLYLMGRSYATRRWYLSKFEDFPINVKALIPFVF